MKSPVLIAVAAVIAGGFLLFMMTYTVRFNEVAIVSTFGSADAEDVVAEPGLKLKWPAPVQDATVYDRRVRYLETRAETQQTADQRQIIVGGFLTWRVDAERALTFYQRFRGAAGATELDHYRAAEDVLRASFRSALAEVSRYELSELFAPGDASRLAELEARVLERLTRSDEAGGEDVGSLGVELELVGINSVRLPESVTREVFTQMEEERAKLAADAESEGEALAASIRTEAQNDATRILSFVNRRASEIRTRGDIEAARQLERMDRAPELAVFLERVRLMREGLGRRLTLVLDWDVLGLELFGPDGLPGVESRLLGGGDGASGRGAGE